MPGPDLTCFLLNHPDSAQRFFHGHQIWLGHGWNDNFDLPVILQFAPSPNTWSKILKFNFCVVPPGNIQNPNLFI